jgi:predicted HTH domain antitoxin
MAKTRNLTVRLDRELVKRVEQEARRESTDKSTIARKLTAIGIQQTQKARAVDGYRRGKCTIWKASEMAGVPLREMMEILRREKISLHVSPEDMDEALREALAE